MSLWILVANILAWSKISVHGPQFTVRGKAELKLILELTARWDPELMSLLMTSTYIQDKMCIMNIHIWDDWDLSSMDLEADVPKQGQLNII